MATADRRNSAMTALASVPRLNDGLPTLRRDQPEIHFRAKQLHDGFNLKYRQPQPLGSRDD
jgi:hypothetical protein